MHAKLSQSCPTLCDPMDCSPLGSSVCGILQARVLEWAAISFSRGSSQPRVWTLVSYVSCIGRWILYPWDIGKAIIYSHAHSVIKTTSSGRERLSVAATAKLLQLCPTLCDPIDGSPPGSTIPGILQAGVGSHFLLQYMKVKSESEVAQSCPTLRNLMDCSPPGSSAHGIFQARVLEWVAIAFSGSSVTIPILCRCQLGLVGGELPKLPTTS